MIKRTKKSVAADVEGMLGCEVYMGEGQVTMTKRRGNRIDVTLDDGSRFRLAVVALLKARKP